MRKIMLTVLLTVTLLFISIHYIFAFNMPSGHTELAVGIGGIDELSTAVCESYKIKIISVTVTYADSSTAEIYSNTDGSTEVDLIATTAGTNGIAFISVEDVPKGTITKVEIVISNTVKIKGYQNLVSDADNVQCYTTSNSGATLYGIYAAAAENHNTTNAEEVTIDVSGSNYNATTAQRTLTVSDLNIVISSETAKGLKLVFDLSDVITFGGVMTGEEVNNICVVPGAPSITASSGEIQ